MRNTIAGSMNQKPSQLWSTLSRPHAVASRGTGLDAVVWFRTTSVIDIPLTSPHGVYPPARWRGGSATGTLRRWTGVGGLRLLRALWRPPPLTPPRHAQE